MSIQYYYSIYGIKRKAFLLNKKFRAKWLLSSGSFANETLSYYYYKT